MTISVLGVVMALVVCAQCSSWDSHANNIIPASFPALEFETLHFAYNKSETHTPEEFLTKFAVAYKSVFGVDAAVTIDSFLTYVSSGAKATWFNTRVSVTLKNDGKGFFPATGVNPYYSYRVLRTNALRVLNVLQASDATYQFVGQSVALGTPAPGQGVRSYAVDNDKVIGPVIGLVFAHTLPVVIVVFIVYLKEERTTSETTIAALKKSNIELRDKATKYTAIELTSKERVTDLKQQKAAVQELIGGANLDVVLQTFQGLLALKRRMNNEVSNLDGLHRIQQDLDVIAKRDSSLENPEVDVHGADVQSQNKRRFQELTTWVAKETRELSKLDEWLAPLYERLGQLKAALVQAEVARVQLAAWRLLFKFQEWSETDVPIDVTERKLADLYAALQQQQLRLLGLHPDDEHKDEPVPEGCFHLYQSLVDFPAEHDAWNAEKQLCEISGQITDLFTKITQKLVEKRQKAQDALKHVA